MITLKIDSSDNLETRVALDMEGQTSSLIEKRKTPGEQNILVLVEKILKKNKISLREVTAVEINTGPGSFTGLKVGASIANAISFGANISINGKEIGEIVTPTY